MRRLERGDLGAARALYEERGGSYNLHQGEAPHEGTQGTCRMHEVRDLRSMSAVHTELSFAHRFLCDNSVHTLVLEAPTTGQLTGVPSGAAQGQLTGVPSGARIPHCLIVAVHLHPGL